MTREPPSLQYILALREELRTLHATEDTQIDRHRAVRTLEQKVPVDDNYRVVSLEVRDPTVGDEDWRTTATLSNRRPTCHVTPARPGDTGQENATLREHWTEEVLWEAGKRRLGMHAYKAAVDSCIGDGGAWSKLVIDQDLWDVRYALTPDEYDDDAAYNLATEQAKKESGSPFVWLVPDVRTLYPVYSGTKVTEMLEWQRRPLYATLRQFGYATDAQGNIVPEGLGQPTSIAQPTPSAQFVDFLEHWTDTHCTYVLVGSNISGQQTVERVQQWEHGYGRVPYFPAFGLMTGFWVNRKVGWAASENKRWLVEYRSFLETLLANVAAITALPILKRTRAPGSLPARDLLGDDKRPKDTQRWDLRSIVDLDPGEDLIPLSWPEVADALTKELIRVDEAIRKLEPPRIASDLGSGDLAGAGWAYSQVLTESRLRYGDQVGQLQDMLTEMTRFLWHLVRMKIGEKVWVQSSGDVGWLGAGPEDLGNGVGISWEIDPEVPSAKLIEWRLQHERLKAGTQNLDDAWTEMGENPDEKRRGQMMDTIRAQGWYQQALMLHTLQEIGRGDMMTDSAAATQIAAAGSGQGATPGGMGTAMVPDMGNLATSPNGAGAQPQVGLGPGPGGVQGGSPGVVVPQQAAGAAMIQPIGG